MVRNRWRGVRNDKKSWSINVTNRFRARNGAVHIIKPCQASHVPINLDFVTGSLQSPPPWVSQVIRSLMYGAGDGREEEGTPLGGLK